MDLDALGRHVEWLVGEGVDGLMPCGSMGEGPLLDDREVVEVVNRTVEVAAGRATVMAHVGRPATRATAALAREAAQAGADAVSAVTPWYYALEDAQLLEHYRAVRSAVEDVPVYAYAIPRLAGNEVSPALAEGLAAEGLAGLKDSSESSERHHEYLRVADRHAERGFSVLVGSEALMLEALQDGAAGCVLGLANLRPDLLLELREAARAERWDEAADLQDEVTRLNGELGRGPLFTGLNRTVAERLAARGIDYPAHQRPPLGAVPGRAEAVARP